MSNENEMNPKKKDIKQTEQSQKQSTSNNLGQNYARFFTESFLLNRGWMIFQSLIKTGAYYLLTIAAQLFVFGGGLGLIWVLSHLEPQGDLARYLLPLTILAMPVAVISQSDGWADRLIGIIFTTAFVGFFIWSCVWYFQYPDWGYEAKWIGTEAIALCLLLYFSLKKSLNNVHGPQKALVRRFWLIGIFVSLSSLGFLGYYIAYQTAPEPGTSNLLSGGSFVLFLAILIIRVYWLDGFRVRRANLAEFTHPLDHIILFEWLIPRSFNFTLTLGMLLIAQSMMFSTIYRAYQHQDEQVLQQVILERQLGHGLDLTTPIQDRPKLNASLQLPYSIASNISSPTLPSIRPNVNLGAWMFFSFKPYVFPKDHEGREVDAPLWFKYLGRALIGLIIAILLTKQLNIWKQIMGCYWILLGANRTAKHRGNSLKLTRQQDEMVEHLTGIFNHYSLVWRWLLLYAVTAPTLSLKWRIILDPGSAYYLGLERAHDWVVERWHAAIACAAGFIAITTLPFCYFHPEHLPHFVTSFAPSAITALFLFLLRLSLSLRPPNSYQWWIWWLLLFHSVVSVLNFFLTINLGTDQTFWTRILWYIELGTIFVYPVIYLLGTDRYKSINRPDRRLSVHPDDCDVEVRRRLLVAFSNTEHRQWFISQLTQKIHPVRSSALHLRLITPSLILNTLEGLRGLMVTLREFLTPLFGTYRRALRAWPGLILAGWFLTLTFHLFVHHKALPLNLMLAYLIDLGIVLSPSLLVLFIHWFLDIEKKTKEPLVHFWVNISLLSFSSAIAVWAWFNVPTLTSSVMSPLFELRTYRAWLLWFICPMLPLWRLLRPWLKQRSVKRIQKESDENLASSVRFSVLRRMESFLQRLEEQLVSSVYQKTTRGRLFEFSYQSTMILNLAKIVETSFERLRNGEWFHEERHALSRVRSEVLSKTHPQANHRAEITEELCAMLESSLDTLGSLLHDLTLTKLLPLDENEAQPRSHLYDRRRQLTTPPNPNIEIVIEALCLIATYPLPEPIESSDLLSPTASDRLYACHGEVIALVRHLTLLTSNHDRTLLKRELTGHHRVQLLRLWCLLEAQSELNTPQDQGLPAALEFAFNAVETGQSFEFQDPILVQELLRSTLTHPQGSLLTNRLLSLSPKAILIDDYLLELLALHILPTPIAILLKSLQDNLMAYETAEDEWRACHQNRVDAERKTGEFKRVTPLSIDVFEPLNLSSQILRNLQSPPQIALIEREISAQRQLDAANRARYEALYTLYFGTFAYMVSTLKDLCDDELIQGLSWQSADAVEESLAVITTRKEDLHSDKANDLGQLMTELFESPQASFIEQSCRDRRSWVTAYQQTRTMLTHLVSSLENEYQIPYYIWGGQKDMNTEGDSLSLLMRGLYPRFWNKIEHLNSNGKVLKSSLSEPHPSGSHQDFNEQNAKDVLILGRGVRLEDSNRAPQIDYYSALWLLNLLYSLVNSDEILKSPHEMSEKIDRLNILLTRIGKILRPFAGEEQVVIERIFDKTFRRLVALKTMGAEGHDILGGKGTVEFVQTFKRAEDYINGLEATRKRELSALSWLGLPPHLEFSFLLSVERTDEGELRTYLSLGGHPEVIFRDREQVVTTL